jgi:hypothetical protein
MAAQLKLTHISKIAVQFSPYRPGAASARSVAVCGREVRGCAAHAWAGGGGEGGGGVQGLFGGSAVRQGQGDKPQVRDQRGRAC